LASVVRKELREVLQRPILSFGGAV
jgi:hypothetical protein